MLTGTTSANPQWCPKQAAMWAPKQEVLPVWLWLGELFTLSTSAKDTALLRKTSVLQMLLHRQIRCFSPVQLSLPHTSRRYKLVDISSDYNSSGKFSNTDDLLYCLFFSGACNSSLFDNRTDDYYLTPFQINTAAVQPDWCFMACSMVLGTSILGCSTSKPLQKAELQEKSDQHVLQWAFKPRFQSWKSR